MSTDNHLEGNIYQIPPQRSVGGNQFTAGNIDYILSVGKPNVFMPSESYFVIDYTLTYNGRQPVMGDGIAPSNDMGSALFSDCSVKLSGQDVSTINNYIPQASIVKKRLHSTDSWVKSTGLHVHGYSPSFIDRQKLVCWDGQDPYKVDNQVSCGTAVSTVAVTAATGAVVGIGTDFTATNPTHLIVGGFKLTVIAVVDALNLTVAITPELTANGNIAATNKYDAYRIDRRFSEGANKRTLIWKPPIGFFDLDEPIGAGNIQITLNPNSKYDLAGVETKRAMTVGVGADQYVLNINNITFYAANYKKSLPDSPLELYLKEINIQSKQLTGNSETFQFTVKPSCYALSWFVQRTSAGTASNIPISKFVTTNNEELGINSYQLTYGNKTVPPSKITQRILNGAVDITNNRENSLTQRYYDTMTACNLINIGGESLSEWIENGQLVHINFIRDSSFSATQVQFNIDSAGAYTNPTTLYLVEHYNTSTQVDIMDGLIVSVQSLKIL